MTPEWSTEELRHYAGDYPDNEGAAGLPHAGLLRWAADRIEHLEGRLDRGLHEANADAWLAIQERDAANAENARLTAEVGLTRLAGLAELETVEAERDRLAEALKKVMGVMEADTFFDEWNFARSALAAHREAK